MNHISQSMNRISQSMNRISQSMNRISQSMNCISQSMNRISQSMNRISQSMNRFDKKYRLCCLLLQDQIEDLQSTVEKQKKELKKRKDKESTLQTEVDDFREELCKLNFRKISLFLSDFVITMFLC